MPAKTEKQRKFMGAELARKRSGKKTTKRTTAGRSMSGGMGMGGM